MSVVLLPLFQNMGKLYIKLKPKTACKQIIVQTLTHDLDLWMGSKGQFLSECSHAVHNTEGNLA